MGDAPPSYEETQSQQYVPPPQPSFNPAYATDYGANAYNPEYGQHNPTYGQAYPVQGQVNPTYGQQYPPGTGAVYPPNAYQTSYGQSNVTTAAPYESGLEAGNAVVGKDPFAAFSEKSIRNGFIRKVFAILAVQLLITGGIVAVFVTMDDVKDYVQSNSWVLYTSLAVYFVCVIAMSCVESLRRKVPINLLLLGLVTVAMACMLGTIASFYEVDELLIAVGITFGIVLVMMGLGFQTKYDFTAKLGLMVCLTFALLFFGIFAAIFSDNILNIVYASLGALIFSAWLVIDIQMIMGGKKKYTTSPEEYIFAALNLYIDIIQILLFILMLVKGGKN